MTEPGATAADSTARARLAVLGSPIAHSKSPTLHAAAYRALGLDWEYGRLDVQAAGLQQAMARGWRGLSLTMPLKQEAFRLVDDADPVARLTGAVNTVLFDPASSGRDSLSSAGAHTTGFNTDVGGVVRALGAFLGRGEALGRVLLLGGGATAGSVVVAAAELGADEVIVAMRSPEKAGELRRLAASAGVDLGVIALADAAATADARLVVNTIPGDVDPSSSAGLAFDPAFRRRAPLFDVIYDPWPTRLARSWLDGGGRVLTGLTMLVEQALLQVRIFTAGSPAAPAGGTAESDAKVLAAMYSSVGLEPPGAPHVGGARR